LHRLAGAAVGVDHALAPPLVAQLRPCLLEVSLGATIGFPCAAGVLLLDPRVAGFLLFGPLLVLLFSVCLVIFEGVAFHLCSLL
jgi:hypothetical protein